MFLVSSLNHSSAGSPSLLFDTAGTIHELVNYYCTLKHNCSCFSTVLKLLWYCIAAVAVLC